VRLSESLESSEVSSCKQGVLMDMGSIDLIDCQVGRKKSHVARCARESR
jgi:hypothetical protein